jgi:alkanesulfonate monooxygenase SsuD/methylene tetrahydromethanopterin reductase-like flavin-dependent oxidoreductase (luciferase family)
MRFGSYTPNFDFCGDARVLADLAHAAETAGWDGFFIWDHLQFGEPTVDPWIALTAMALRTQRIRLGPLVTPVPRRHIAKLAREIISLDRLSGGRLILGVGAGFSALPDYTAFGDVGDPKLRAAKLDEALEVLASLLSGAPVRHVGVHYRVDCEAFEPPLQRPRVPVWVAASWPAKKPLLRASQWDGIVPVNSMGLEVPPEHLRHIVVAIREQRGDNSAFDIVAFGKTRDPADTALVRDCAAAGATWWMESIFTRGNSLAATRARIEMGPPRMRDPS